MGGTTEKDVNLQSSNTNAEYSNDKICVLTKEHFFRPNENMHIQMSDEFPDYIGIWHKHEYIEVVYIISGAAIHEIIFWHNITSFYSIIAQKLTKIKAQALYIIRNLLRYITETKFCISSSRRKCMHGYAVMICQVCDLDKKQPKLSPAVQFRLFLVRMKGLEPPR